MSYVWVKWEEEMKKILIYENGAFTAAYHQLNVIPGSDLDKWIAFEVNTGVSRMWMSGKIPWKG